MQRVSKTKQKALCAGAQSQLAAYCGAFRTSSHTPQPLNHSWVAPLVAPARPDPATEPPEYRFASRAPAVRRSPANKDPRQKSAHHGHPSASPANGKLSTSSCAHQSYARAAPEQFDSHTMRHYDWDGQYDEFLASFQHRIDGMTGQRGGWGF
ncbi:hypothetical protein BC826DRAFT_206143 [Russula brevipes]|nr:hypothetical protein BC826DRAFT_206143 [Russula brevipes]